jgi:hypothetical protein
MPPWPRVSLLSSPDVGLVALFVGASLVMLRVGGGPWHASISDSAGTGWTTVEIIDEDGTAYRFTGSSTGHSTGQTASRTS